MVCESNVRMRSGCDQPETPHPTLSELRAATEVEISVIGGVDTVRSHTTEVVFIEHVVDTAEHP